MTHLVHERPDEEQPAAGGDEAERDRLPPVPALTPAVLMARRNAILGKRSGGLAPLPATRSADAVRWAWKEAGLADGCFVPNVLRNREKVKPLQELCDRLNAARAAKGQFAVRWPQREAASPPAPREAAIPHRPVPAPASA